MLGFRIRFRGSGHTICFQPLQRRPRRQAHPLRLVGGRGGQRLNSPAVVQRAKGESGSLPHELHTVPEGRNQRLNCFRSAQLAQDSRSAGTPPGGITRQFFHHFGTRNRVLKEPQGHGRVDGLEPTMGVQKRSQSGHTLDIPGLPQKRGSVAIR